MFGIKRKSIKNRIAAQECRRKKRQHVEQLEDQIRALTQQNQTLLSLTHTAESRSKHLENQNQELKVCYRFFD